MKLKQTFFVTFLFLLGYAFANNQIGYIYYEDGTSFIKNNKVHLQYKKTTSGRAIYSGDVIKVNENSICSIFFEDDKTQIIIDEKSRIQIIDSDLTREVKIDNGSIYIHNLHYQDKKFYVFTNNNQFFIESDRVWIKSDFFKGDKLYSLDNPVKVYNNINEHSLEYDKDKVHYYLNSGKIIFSNILDNIVPQYVLDRIGENQNKISKIKLRKYDLIPVYGDRIRDDEDVSLMKYSYSFQTLSLNEDTFFSFGFYPRYKYRSLSVGFDLSPNINSNGELLDDDWDDAYDFIDRLKVNYYYRNNVKRNEMHLQYGHISNYTFAQGYLLKKISNSIDYPRLRNSGLQISYKFDNDFIDLQVAIPSFRELFSSGGLIAARTSLFISHRFPLTLGLGFVADINQLAFVDNQYNVSLDKKRTIYGAEFDYFYDLFSFRNLNISLFGELVGIWYPEYSYYVIFDNANQIADDLRYRKGVWGLKAPGFQFDISDKIELKIAMNYNSALFIPNYFNSNYMTNRARYYQGDLNFPLVDEQIDLLNQFKIKGTSDEYMIPKDLYPLLNENKGFSEHKVYGFSTDLNYKIKKYFEFKLSTAVFVEDSNSSDSFYSFETSFKIKDNYIKRISFMNFYLSNIFFENFSDKERQTLGMNLGIKLPYRLSLIFDLAQVYYDLNLKDNNLDQMINTTLGIKYNF